MKNGKYSRKGSKQIVTLLLALVLILGCGIGGTLAYLTANTQAVTNTFVMGDIGTLTLTEPQMEANTNEDDNYVIIPGVEITKDPIVKYTPVTETEEIVQVPVYVFVKISTGDAATNWNVADGVYSISLMIDKDGNKVETGGTQTTLMSWEVNTATGAWTAVPNTTGVYYKALAADENLGTDGLAVIKDNKITVSEQITKDTIDDVALAAQDITFTAYAVQQDSFADAADAWTKTFGA